MTAVVANVRSAMLSPPGGGMAGGETPKKNRAAQALVAKRWAKVGKRERQEISRRLHEQRYGPTRAEKATRPKVLEVGARVRWEAPRAEIPPGVTGPLVGVVVKMEWRAGGFELVRIRLDPECRRRRARGQKADDGLRWVYADRLVVI